MSWRLPGLVLQRFRVPILLVFAGSLVITGFRWLERTGDCGYCGYAFFASTAALLILLGGLWALGSAIGLLIEPPWRQADSGVGKDPGETETADKPAP